MTSETKKRIAEINSGIVPDGYKKTKVGIVPVEWEYETLGKYLIQYHDVTTENNQYPVLTSSRKGIFFQSDYYKKEVASEDNTGYNIVPYGYFTYRHMSDDEIFFFNINDIAKFGIVSTLYPVFTTTDEIDDQYLRLVLNYGNEFKRYSILQKQGGSRTYMYFAKLQKFKLFLPPLAEQQKIAEILSTQDKLIELHEKKVENLKELKKAYLQKMFPQKGSKYPEIRFKGFTDAWEQRKLGNIVTVYDGVHQTPNYQTSGVMFLSVENITTLQSTKFISEEDFKRDYKVYPQENDILMTRIGDVGSTNVITDNGLKAYYVSLALLKYKGTNPFFLSNAIQSDFVQNGLANRTLKTAIPMKINKEEIGKVDVMLPLSSDEQKKIGDYFRNLDTLITLHQRKLDKEKEKKKALMQLLLTGKVRVKP